MSCSVLKNIIRRSSFWSCSENPDTFPFSAVPSHCCFFIPFCLIIFFLACNSSCFSSSPSYLHTLFFVSYFLCSNFIYFVYPSSSPPSISSVPFLPHLPPPPPSSQFHLFFTFLLLLLSKFISSLLITFPSPPPPPSQFQLFFPCLLLLLSNFISSLLITFPSPPPPPPSIQFHLLPSPPPLL